MKPHGPDQVRAREITGVAEVPDSVRAFFQDEVVILPCYLECEQGTFIAVQLRYGKVVLDYIGAHRGGSDQ